MNNSLHIETGVRKLGST